MSAIKPKKVRVIDLQTGNEIRDVIRYNFGEQWVERFVGTWSESQHRPELSDDLKTVKEYRPFRVEPIEEKV